MRVKKGWFPKRSSEDKNLLGEVCENIEPGSNAAI